MITRKLSNKVLISGLFYTSLFGTLAVTSKNLYLENYVRRQKLQNQKDQMNKESQVFEDIVQNRIYD